MPPSVMTASFALEMARGPGSANPLIKRARLSRGEQLRSRAQEEQELPSASQATRCEADLVEPKKTQRLYLWMCPAIDAMCTGHHVGPAFTRHYLPACPSMAQQSAG